MRSNGIRAFGAAGADLAITRTIKYAGPMRHDLDPAVIFSLLLPLIGVLGCASPDDRPDVSPNIILIVLDTVRRDHLSCYGYERATSPNLDNFAREATLYTNAMSPAPWTLPSHASMFTGLLPSRHQAHHEHLHLDDDHKTIAETLAHAGYETAGFCNNPWVTEQIGMTQGFERYEEVWRTQVSKGTFDMTLFVEPDEHGMSDAGAAETLRRIEHWLGERDDAERPFFLFVNVIEPHGFYDPPESHRNRFTREPLSRADVKRANLDYMKNAFADSLTASDVEHAMALYDGEIAYTDEWLGGLLALLDVKGRLDGSLVIITSDHGELFGEHRLCGVRLIDHQLSLSRQLLDVPLVVRYPDTTRTGLRIDSPVSLVDLFPTVLRAAAISIPDRIDGCVLPTDEDPPAHGVRALTSEYFRPIIHLGFLHDHVADTSVIDCLVNRRLASVCEDDRKAIVSSRGNVWRHDLGTDPDELQPMPKPDTPDPLVTSALERLRVMEASPSLPPPELGPAVDEALRSLGYIE